MAAWRINEIINEYAEFNPKITPHSLRHATATHMLKRGANIIYLQALLGHTSPVTTQVYTRLYPKDLIGIYNRFHPCATSARYGSEDVDVKRLDYKEFTGNLFQQIDNCSKYIEELGEGWNKILEEHKKHPLKPKLPTVDTDDYMFLVNIYSTKEKFVEKTDKRLGEGLGERLGVKLGENEEKILRLIVAGKFVTIDSIAKSIRISTTAVENNLAKLKEKGMLRRVGSDKSGHWEVLR